MVATPHGLPKNARIQVAKVTSKTSKRLASLCSYAITAALPATALGEPVQSTGKAITGGALLGAELMVFTEAALGFESPWYFAAGAGLGAVGGGVGGYYIERAGNAELSLYMLVGGMALVIPASITYLDAVAYSPEEAEPLERPTIHDGFELGAGERFPTAASVRPVPLSPSLVVLHDHELRIGVPNVVVDNAYTRTEMLEFSLPSTPSVLVPMLAGSF